MISRNSYGWLLAVVALLFLGALLAVFMDRDDPMAFIEDDPDVRNHPNYPVRVTDIGHLENDVIVERNIKIRVRDDIPLSANVFRPKTPGAYPVIMAFTAYDKNKGPDQYPKLLRHSLKPEFDLGTFKISPWTSWEGPDPAYWVPQGYVVVYVDARGFALSKGSPHTLSRQDRDDFYDAITWAGEQSFSNGNVGLSGVSYLAISQWVAASGNPPNLKAIMPWEGQSDSFREVLYHGGIPEVAFTSFWLRKMRAGANGNPLPPPAIFEFAHQRPELMRRVQQRPVTRSGIELDQIIVPALIAATWSDHVLHSRGSFEGYKRIASEQKWLYIHGRQKWQVYYSAEALATQKAFFDYFLKGVDNGYAQTPPVRLEVRESLNQYTVRYADDWPLPNTRYKELYLHADSAELSHQQENEAAVVNYHSTEGAAVFTYQFQGDTELTGNMKLRLWVSTDAGEDMDLFVAVDKLDRRGARVPFYGKTGFNQGPAALGWLRVSQRQLDESLSTPWQPVLSHTQSLPIQPGDIVPVDIEILPSSTLFRAGESLQLTVQGTDIFEHPSLAHGYPVNQGSHQIHTGGRFDSHLLVPVIPN